MSNKLDISHRSGMQQIVINASFEEKSVWIQLVSLVVVLGSYFVKAWTLLAAGVTALAPYIGLFVAATILLVVVLAIGHVVVAIASRPEGRDERDRLIEWRAESNSSWILAAGVFGAIVALVAAVDDVWIANLLMLSMLLTEVAKLTFQLVYYRRGV